MLVSMTVLRDGYWDGQYPRAGDVITVDAGVVESLEIAGFAIRRVEDASVASARVAKGSKHGR
jgi:hypothetical protein